jgi:peptide/nickel transport system permease protein
VTAVAEAPVALQAHAGVRRKPTMGLLGWIGAGLLAAYAVLAVLAPTISPYRTTELAGRPLEAPSADHLLGTNSVGQDVLSQLLSGARVSLFVAVVAGGGAVLIGALIGMVAGWLGGVVDALLMRLVDVVLVVPKVPLLILVGALAGPALGTISVIIALTSWPPGARVIRSQVLSLRRRAHLKASTGFGAGTRYVLRHHVVPEIGLIVAAGLVGAAGRAVMLESGLAFLGLGDPSRSSWGQMMRDALDFPVLFQIDAWQWWLLPPLAAVSLFLLGVAFVGVGVEARLNPRLARHR